MACRNIDAWYDPLGGVCMGHGIYVRIPGTVTVHGGSGCDKEGEYCKLARNEGLGETR